MPECGAPPMQVSKDPRLALFSHQAMGRRRESATRTRALASGFARLATGVRMEESSLNCGFWVISGCCGDRFFTLMDYARLA